MSELHTRGKDMENPDCACPSVDCSRHGKCSECREHHHGKGGLTNCERGKNPEARQKRKELKALYRKKKREEKARARLDKRKKKKERK